MGDLTADFRRELDQRKKSLEEELGYPISFELVDQERIAMLYAYFVVQSSRSPEPRLR
jgi:hypothetical protein